MIIIKLTEKQKKRGESMIYLKIKNKINQNYGITLIAMIITIIILLILAGISIVKLTGDNRSLTICKAC